MVQWPLAVRRHGSNGKFCSAMQPLEYSMLHHFVEKSLISYVKPSRDRTSSMQVKFLKNRYAKLYPTYPEHLQTTKMWAYFLDNGRRHIPGTTVTPSQCYSQVLQSTKTPDFFSVQQLYKYCTWKNYTCVCVCVFRKAHTHI